VISLQANVKHPIRPYSTIPTMSKQQIPPGWDEDRVKRLISHYESLNEDEQVAEDEAALSDQQGQTVISVPDALLPVIRQLIAETSTH
jgi:hypothetical protein